MKSERTIKQNIKRLRHIVDTSTDPVESRIAYAMETALRWASLKTVGWPTMDAEAKTNAAILRDELNR
jgi:hypothetical protein